MKVINIDQHRSLNKQLKSVITKTRLDTVFIYPTDTIYGLGCNIFSKEAINRISNIKKRSQNTPFSFICKDITQVSEFAVIADWAYGMINNCLPGPYTFILEARKTNIPTNMLGERNTVGVRIPGNNVCQTILELIEQPILSTSVNLSGQEPIHDPSQFPKEFLSKVDVIISAGLLENKPSTVIDISGSKPILIRAGKGEIPW
ncbi:MAG TPA: L-threonylcarbamoyladenylate synthase [Nitrospinota bacterium]|nr:L-threonylcarbamoyladenylate synthase [Nitrospinota bacterium]|tara:strand:+ start:180283 stop:180891 length:609 start_codon:yes stop_codon:yes gene_type:complete